MPAAALTTLAPAAHADPGPACVSPDHRTFPLGTRIHGGPDSYTPGGGHGTWYLDLTNTTTRTCTGIHPVVVLVDDQRALKPAQARLEFFAGGRPYPVRFETTDRDELVGAFTGVGDRFPGFTVGPRRTLTVRVRLAFTSDAAPNRVTANAAVVQRQEGDGDWVGQSGDYRFSINADTNTDTNTDLDTDTDPDVTDPATPQPSPDASASSAGPGVRLPFADELARTGTVPARAALATAGALLLTGLSALLLRRRR
ncbi:hypothetical protein H8R17_38560 [Streptomyces sp. TRM68367]|nr:hypothetical protein [Streptomyces sp. TRM68367]MBC9730402.1 hypothetical protein [Streptomyces sp. TRM68367]